MHVLSDSNFCTLGFCRLLVGAPYEMNGPYQTGDVYKCSLSKRTNSNGCSKLNLGIVLPLIFYQRITMCLFVFYMCLYVSMLFYMSLSHHLGDMCETEVWGPYQSFHILLFFKMVYVHFHTCVIPHI